MIKFHSSIILVPDFIYSFLHLLNKTWVFSTSIKYEGLWCFMFSLYIFQVCRKTKLDIFSNFYLQSLSRLCFICFMLKNVCKLLFYFNFVIPHNPYHTCEKCLIYSCAKLHIFSFFTFVKQDSGFFFEIKFYFFLAHISSL